APLAAAARGQAAGADLRLPPHDRRRRLLDDEHVRQELRERAERRPVLPLPRGCPGPPGWWLAGAGEHRLGGHERGRTAGVAAEGERRWRAAMAGGAWLPRGRTRRLFDRVLVAADERRRLLPCRWHDRLRLGRR